jgi:hypothetical protein
LRAHQFAGIQMFVKRRACELVCRLFVHTFVCLLSSLKDVHRTGLPGAANIMCQSKTDVTRQLALASFTAQLLPDLDHLPGTGRAHGMPLGLQTARGVNRPVAS